MSTLTAPRAALAPAATRRRDDVVTVVASLWLMIGLFVDGWAHNNLAELETFFTPWHGVFYSGFTATGLWMLWLVHRRREPGTSIRAAIPDGYALGLVGLAVFAVGGVGDMVWHTIYGIETDLDALYSPTHVLLFTGMALVLTSPVRAAWRRPGGSRPSWREFLPALGGATLTASMLTFAFMYWSPVLDAWPATPYVEWAQRDDIVNLATLAGMASLFVPVLLLVGMLALLLRRWTPPAGTATVLFTVPTLLASALGEFAFLDLVVSAVVAGVATDVVIARVRPTAGSPWRLRAVTAFAGAALTGTYLVAVALTRGVGWAPEFTFGVVVWAAALGLALGTLVAPPALPQEQPIG